MRAAKSRLLRFDEGEAYLDIELAPAKSILLTLLTPDGEPASGAKIGLVQSGAQLQFEQGDLGIANGGDETCLLHADQTGQFSWVQGNAVNEIIVAHESGFLKLKPALLVTHATNAVIRLQPWGRIEGKLHRGGRPLADQPLSLQCFPGEYAANYLSTSVRDLTIATDLNGSFTFAKVPPGRHEIVFWATIDPANQADRFPLPLPAEVRSGETLRIEPFEMPERIVLPPGMGIPTGTPLSLLMPNGPSPTASDPNRR